MAKSKPIIAIKADPDDPEDFDISQEDLQRALEERRKRIGRPPSSNKELVSLRLDKDLLERFRSGGAGWQTRINEALRKATRI